MAAISGSATPIPDCARRWRSRRGPVSATGLRLKRRMCHRRWHELIRATGRRGPTCCLAARFVDGPHLSDPDEAEQRLAGWLADLAPEQAAAIRGLVGAVSARQDHSSGHRGSLALSVRPDARRCRARRSGCSIAIRSEHLAQLIDTTCRDVVAAASEAEAMQLLRRMKSEAALLIALCDIGGVWPVMRVTAALTDLAVASVQAALRYLLRAGSRARRSCRRPTPIAPRTSSGLIVLAMGKMGAGELNYSSDIDLIVFFDSERADAGARYRAAAVFRARHAGPGAAAAAAHRRRLRVPRRPAAAAGSGLDARSRSRSTRRCIITSGKGGPGSAPP